MPAYFDLHCDTLLHTLEGHGLVENNLCISVKRGLVNSPWVQAFAAFIHDNHDNVPDEGYEKFLKMAAIYKETLAANPGLLVEYNPFEVDPTRCNAMLTVEGGAAIGGRPERIEELAKMGVRIFSLVWSEENLLAGGVNSESGLKPAGVETVKELERCGVVLDVSHINVKGFWELCNIATKPFIATHSNSISICKNIRNLADDQVKEIVRRGGIVGLNYHQPFMHDREATDGGYADMARHIEKMLALGAENALTLGSDFDGALYPENMDKIEKMPAFIHFIEKEYGAAFAAKISFENANNFFKKTMAK